MAEAGFISPCELLLDKLNKKEILSLRNKKNNYVNSIPASLNQKELALILDKQEELGFSFSPDFKKSLINLAFYRRPLKDFSAKVGACIFYEHEKGAPKNSLSALEFVAVSSIINELSYLEKHGGGPYDYKKIINDVLSETKVGKVAYFTYAKFRKSIKLDEKIKFSHLRYKDENSEKEKFISYEPFRKLRDITDKLRPFSEAEFDNIALALSLAKDRDLLKKKLKEFNLDEFSDGALNEMLGLGYSKFSNLSLRALREILPLMKEGMRYDEAWRILGLRERGAEQAGKFLPPLDETIYELVNPVVARAIAQFRKVLNSIIKEYGPVHKIRFELTREARNSYKRRQEYEKAQKENEKLNRAAEALCREAWPGRSSISNDDITKFKLWLEQNEFCLYSGKKISIDDIVKGVTEVDHIWPYSRSFDDSYSNKVLVFKKENQNKTNKTPYEAFGDDPEIWGEILQRAKNLKNPAKYKRIIDENFETRDGEFKDRNLNDTGYIASLIMKYTRNYLEFLPLEKGVVHVEATKGSLTAMLRHYWGYGKKDRGTHLHHFIDAAIISACTPGVVKAFSDYHKNEQMSKAKFYPSQSENGELKKTHNKFDPFPGFRKTILEASSKIFISKPVRKRARGALHEETVWNKERALSQRKFGFGSEHEFQLALELGKIRPVNNGYAANGPMVRVDIFAHPLSGQFYGVPIYTMDFALGRLPNKAAGQNWKEKGWIEMDGSYEFKFSLFKDDLIEIQKKDMSAPVLCYFNSFDVSNASISVTKHDNDASNLSDDEKKLYTLSKNKPSEPGAQDLAQTQESYSAKLEQGRTGILTLKTFQKLQVSPLGKRSPWL